MLKRLLLTRAGSRRLSASTLLALGLWLLLVATNPGRNETIDVTARLAVTRQLWTAGTVIVQDRPSGTDGVWIEVAPDRYAAPYGIGQSLLFVPFDIVGAVMERVGPETWRAHLAWIPIGLGLLPLVGLGYWYVLRKLLLEWGFEATWATLGSLVMMLGTLTFFYAGQGQEETLVGVCLALALLYSIRLRRQPGWQCAAAAGGFAGACLVVRMNAVFALVVIPVLILTLQESWRTRVRCLAISGVALCAIGSLALWYNAARFGGAFAVGYDRMGHFSEFALDQRAPLVFLALVFGLGGGLVTMSPVIAVSLAGVHRLWERDKAYLLGTAAALILCYLFFSGWHDSYTGGFAWGTRYQAHLLALLAIPVTHGLQHLAGTVGGRRVAGTVIALSVAVQGVSVFATHHLEPYQDVCDGVSELGRLGSPVNGQLPLRVQNLVRWARGAEPRPVRDPACRATIQVMWERYVPNFWGPVYAHRLSSGASVVLMAWWAALVGALTFLGMGLRREVAPRIEAFRRW